MADSGGGTSTTLQGMKEERALMRLGQKKKPEKRNQRSVHYHHIVMTSSDHADALRLLQLGALLRQEQIMSQDEYTNAFWGIRKFPPSFLIT